MIQHKRVIKNTPTHSLLMHRHQGDSNQPFTTANSLHISRFTAILPASVNLRQGCTQEFIL